MAQELARREAPRILLVGHARWGATTAVIDCLTAAGMTPADLVPAERAARAVADVRPQLTIIDMAADSSPPPDLCKSLRLVTQGHILVVARVGDKAAIIKCLESGADEYALYPGDQDLLLARLRAWVRRSSSSRAGGDWQIQVRDLIVDIQACEVTRRGERIPLTPTQFRILACLARRPGQVLSARELVQEAQGYAIPEREAQELVKVHIRHLRSRLETRGAHPYVVNVRGFGYLFERRNAPRPE